MGCWLRVNQFLTLSTKVPLTHYNYLFIVYIYKLYKKITILKINSMTRTNKPLTPEQREKNRLYCKAWRNKNKQYYQDYYLKHREEYLARNRGKKCDLNYQNIWRARNPNYMVLWMRRKKEQTTELKKILNEITDEDINKVFGLNILTDTILEQSYTV